MTTVAAALLFYFYAIETVMLFIYFIVPEVLNDVLHF